MDNGKEHGNYSAAGSNSKAYCLESTLPEIVAEDSTLNPDLTL